MAKLCPMEMLFSFGKHKPERVSRTPCPYVWAAHGDFFEYSSERGKRVTLPWRNLINTILPQAGDQGQHQYHKSY